MSKKQKWQKTIEHKFSETQRSKERATKERDRLARNRYRKSGKDVVQVDEERDNREWSFRDEVSGRPSIESRDNLELRIEKGIRVAKRRGLLGSKCYKTALLLRRPILRSDAAERITRYIPYYAPHKDGHRFILGLDNFENDMSHGRIKYDLYLTDNRVGEYDESTEVALLTCLPRITNRLIFVDPYFQLQVVDIPDWIHDRTRKDMSRESIPEDAGEIPEDEGQPGGSEFSISDIADAF